MQKYHFGLGQKPFLCWAPHTASARAPLAPRAAQGEPRETACSSTPGSRAEGVKLSSCPGAAFCGSADNGRDLAGRKGIQQFRRGAVTAAGQGEAIRYIGGKDSSDFTGSCM